MLLQFALPAFVQKFSSFLLGCAIVLSACSPELDSESSILATRSETLTNEPTNSSVDSNSETTDIAWDLVYGYLELIDADNQAILANLQSFQETLNEFITQSNETKLQALRSSWLVAHTSYELASLHRHFSTAVVSEEFNLELLQLQYQINHWPILPGYIDYVDDYPDSGIVNDMTVNLDSDNIRQQHGVFDLSESTLGFHVLEFLLWGESTIDGVARPATEFAEISQLSEAQLEASFKLEQLGNNRRREFITVITSALLEDFGRSKTIWDQTNLALRERIDTFTAERLLRIFVDAISTLLSEEILIRSLYPLLNEEFSDSIQSPYSKSTPSAVTAQLSGIERLLLEIRSDSGKSLDELFISFSPDYEELFYASFDASKECLVLLYSSLQNFQTSLSPLQTEFDVVECINLVTNTIDHLGQIDVSLSN